MPRRIGSSIVTTFCISRLTTGNFTPMASPRWAVVACMISGTVKRVMRLLTAVSDTDRATSPLASIEKTLDELPPGQQAMSIRPMVKSGLSDKAPATPQAMRGSRSSWPIMPARTAL